MTSNNFFLSYGYSYKSTFERRWHTQSHIPTVALTFCAYCSNTIGPNENYRQVRLASLRIMDGHTEGSQCPVATPQLILNLQLFC
jgi:hypothetical protein